MIRSPDPLSLYMAVQAAVALVYLLRQGMIAPHQGGWNGTEIRCRGPEQAMPAINPLIITFPDLRTPRHQLEESTPPVCQYSPEMVPVCFDGGVFLMVVHMPSNRYRGCRHGMP